jgi:hypothetical protein
MAKKLNWKQLEQSLEDASAAIVRGGNRRGSELVLGAMAGGAKNMGKSMITAVNKLNPMSAENKNNAESFNNEQDAREIRVGKMVNSMVDRYKQKQINKLKGKKYAPLLGL